MDPNYYHQVSWNCVNNYGFSLAFSQDAAFSLAESHLDSLMTYFYFHSSCSPDENEIKPLCEFLT